MRLRANPIRMESPERIILRSIREDLMFCKLRSFLPAHQEQMRGTPENIPQTTSDLEPACEIPKNDSSEEGVIKISQHGDEMLITCTNKKDQAEDTDDDDGYIINHDDNDNEEEERRTFIPCIKMKKMDTTLLINTLVLKDVALTSALFRLLEEEKVDIVFENQRRTKTKAAHTILVKLPPDSSLEALKEKLVVWAGNQGQQQKQQKQHCTSIFLIASLVIVALTFWCIGMHIITMI